MATNPAVYYFLDLSQSDPQRGAAWQRENVIAHTPGTILIWDPVFGTSNASRDMIVPQDEIERAGWIWVGNVVYGDAWCNVYLSPQKVSGGKTAEEEYRSPGDVTD
jgi:hypothetical protein